MTTSEQENETRTVYVAVYDTMADWEVGHATAHIHGNKAWQKHPGRYRVVTVGLTEQPVTTVGGMRILPDTTLDAVRPEDAAMLVLPGADLWMSGGVAAFARRARDFVAAGVPVAGICGAVYGLAVEGLLDDRDHTGADAGFIASSGYKGGDRYLEAAAVTGGDVITAGPTEPVAFAREIFAKLDLYEPHVLDAWYRLYEESDASAFPVLMAAASDG